MKVISDDTHVSKQLQFVKTSFYYSFQNCIVKTFMSLPLKIEDKPSNNGMNYTEQKELLHSINFLI